MRIPYLVYRATVARPLGQANAPFNIEEVQRGVVSWIDAIDLHHTGHLDFRAWVRAYEATMEPLYIGIYTVLRRDGVGFVSVGFPLPSANFTATLLPHANRESGMLLKTVSDHDYSGHYLSVVDDANDELSTIELRSFSEEIDVYVRDDQLRTEHRFFLWRTQFMVLHYDIERIEEDS